MELSRSAHVDTFARGRLPSLDEWPELCFLLDELHYPERLNCATELLDRTVRERGGDRPCLLSPTLRWSYAELLETANRIAHVLVDDLGLVAGGRVLLRGPNEPWLVACWFAVLKAGGIAVPSMPMLRSRELATILNMADVDLALCHADHIEDLADCGRDGLRIVAFGRPAAELHDLTAGKGAGFDAVDTAADDVCLLAFTSGTTGRPKATMHFHRDVLAIADTFSRHLLRPAADDVFTGTPPIAFTFGLGGLVVFPLRVGASALLLEKVSPDELFAEVERHRVTVLFTAPTAYRAALPGLADRDLSSLRRCVSAGEALPPATWHAFADLTGIGIIDGIGSTEMLHIFLAAADDDIRPGSTGRPVPGFLAQVVDAQGRPVPDGERGLLAVKGPTGCRYLDGDRQRTYVQSGWNITGDSYVRDADGWFWFQARADDMIVSSGYNISGPEVEVALLRHADVVECAVVGMPDPERGMLVTAFVTLRTGVRGDAALAAELQAFVKAEIAPYKYPRDVRFVDALPRTSSGKLQRFRLREQA